MPSGQEKPRAGKSEVEPRLSAPSPDRYLLCSRLKGGAIFSRWSVIVPQARLRHIKSGKTAKPWTYDG